MRLSKYLWLAWLISLLLALWMQLPRLLDPLQIEEDLRTVYWMQTYWDSTLFPDALYDQSGVTVYEVGSRRIPIEDSSPGYSLLFLAASSVMPMALFNKLLVFPLLLTAVYTIFRIGEQLSDARTALALALVFAVLNLASSTEISVIGGLHRSFVCPILLALLYYLMNGRYGAAAVVVFVSGVIYVPIFPVCAMTYALSLVSWRKDGRWRPRIAYQHLAPLLLAAFSVVVLLSPMILGQLRVTPVEASTRMVETGETAHMLSDPTYQSGGRRELFRLFPLVGRGGIVTGNMDAVHLLTLALLAFVIWLLQRKQIKPWPSVFTNLFVACWLGFALAWLAILLFSSFLFYIPSRHTQSGFLLLLILFVVLNAGQTIRTAAIWMQRHRRQMMWYTIPIIAVAVGVVAFLPEPETGERIFMRGQPVRYVLLSLSLALLVLAILAARRRPAVISTEKSQMTRQARKYAWPIAGAVLLLVSLVYLSAVGADFYTPTPQERALFVYVETLPKDALLAGAPCALDSVPYYGKRSVLFSCEHFILMENRDELVMDALRAYYAEQYQTVTAFCQAYEIDYLVVDRKNFTLVALAEGDYFFEPYNSWLADELHNRTAFALSRVPVQTYAFQTGDWFVVPCRAETLADGFLDH